jgi:hypothetical protein
MAWWTAHSQQGKSADDVVFIRDGFNWWALIFPFPWLVINGMWIVLLIALGLQFVIWALAEAAGASEVMQLILSAAINLILGFEGNALKRWTYARRGHREIGLIEGRDLEEAEYRFFSEIRLPEASPQAAPPAAPLGTSRHWKGTAPDLIFPGFGGRS